MTLSTAAVGQAGVADRRGFVDAAADLADIRWQMFISWALSRKRTLVSWVFPLTSMNTRLAPLHMMSAMSSHQQQLQRSVAEHVVDDVLHQVVGLSDRHRDVLDRHQLGDDVANLLGRRRQVQLRQLGEVDGVEERVEDRRLGLVVVLALLTDDLGRPLRSLRAARKPAVALGSGRGARRPAARPASAASRRAADVRGDRRRASGTAGGGFDGRATGLKSVARLPEHGCFATSSRSGR